MVLAIALYDCSVAERYALGLGNVWMSNVGGMSNDRSSQDTITSAEFKQWFLQV